VLFLVEDFLVVVAVSDFLVVAASFLVMSFFVVDFLVVSFLVVAALSVVDAVVVADSFLVVQEVIKPTVARIAMDVIRDFFIGIC
jgi:hypothetical protein